MLVKGTKIEMAIFPYKVIPPKTNIKTNTMENTKWINKKERIFTSNQIFIGFLFELKKLLKIMI